MQKIIFPYLLVLSLFLLFTDHHDLYAMKTKDRSYSGALEPSPKKQRLTGQDIRNSSHQKTRIPPSKISKIDVKNKSLYEIKIKHSWECHMCGKYLNSDNSLKYHLMAHANIKPHKCGCGKGYTQLINLKSHMKKCQKKENNIPLAEIFGILDVVSHPQITLEPRLEQYLDPNHQIDDLDINDL